MPTALPVSTDVDTFMKSADQAAMRTNLALVPGTNVQAYNATLDAVAGGTYAGDDSIATVGTITAGVWNGTTIAVANGGTGATDSSTARTNLGLAIGTNVQAYNATLAAVAGGTYTGASSITTLGTIATGVWNGTTIAVANGGTGATTAANARTNLGVATPNTYLFINAAAMIPRTTNGCGVNSFETSTNKVNYDTLDFDPAAIEYAQFLAMMPSNWNAGTVTAQFLWTAQSGSGDVVWKLAGRSLQNDDAIDSAMGTAQSATDTLTAAVDMDISPATSAITIGGTPAAGSPVMFEVQRDATNAGDTLAVDANLLGVLIIFTAA